MVYSNRTYVSNREQLSIVLRYVDDTTFMVREDLVVFLSVIPELLDMPVIATISFEELGLDLS